MKTIKAINNKEIAKRLNNESYCDFEDFVKDCKRYISALKTASDCEYKNRVQFWNVSHV